jgi:hypothetical protein
MLTSASRSVRTLFLLVVTALFFGLVVPIAPASAAPATVTVTVTGTAAVGSTLTANVTLNPSSGGVRVDTYKWQSVDGANAPVDITGATTSTYVPTSDMIGKKIQVVVTSTGSSNGQTQPGTGTSPQTAAVVAGTFTTAGTVTISDPTPQVDQQVTASVTGTNPSGATYAYQWYTITGTDPEVLVPGATTSSFTAADTDLGKKLLVKVIASKAGYTSSNQVSSAATTAVAKATFTTPPSVAISDTTPQVDQTVTANVTGTSPPNGVTYAYQWYISPSTIISGETGATYTVRAADLGKKLLVKVIASKSGYTDSTESSSAATTAVAAADFSSPPTVTIDNTTPTVGQTLTASGADAVPSIGTTYSYQWFTVVGSNAPVAIPGATNDTYTVAGADADKKILVKKTASKTGYTPATATSAETSPVARLNFTTEPTVTIDDTTPVVDEVLTATASGEVPTASSYTYQWYTVHDSDPAVAIAGATQSTYTVGAATVGDKIFVRVHAKKSGYNDIIGNSAETVAVVQASFTTPPSVAVNDATPQVDQTVSAVVTATNPSTGVTYAYQWYTISGAGPEVAISGATASTYTAVVGDLGSKLLVKVIASKPGYISPAEVSSAETSAVAAADFTSPPTVTIDDTNPTVGDTLTAGGTDAAPSTGTTYSFQWFTVSGSEAPVAIDGATQSTYDVVGADEGKKILVKKTASKTGYNPVTATSDETSAVAAAEFTTPPAVTIDDTTPVVDEVLTATASGEVPGGSSYTYQWYTVHDSDPAVAIAGATQSTYKVGAATVGDTIFVRVHAKKTGYTDAIDDSPETAAVVKANFTTDPQVSISDISPSVDQEVSAVLNPDAAPAATYAYQWYTIDGSGPAVEISGATGEKYTATADDEGLALQVRVTASRAGYNDSSDTSDATAPVARADFTTPPTVTINDTTPVVDQVLTATASGEVPAASSYTYQWYTVHNSDAAVAIAGATQSTYTVGAATVGDKILVRVHAKKAEYADAISDSAETSAVAKADFATGPQVAISDTTPQVGQEVTAVVTGSTPIGVYSYQWYTVSGSNPAVEISGATGDTYTVTAGDVGLALKVRVTASKTGYNDSSHTSAATSAVAKASFSSGPQVSIDDTTPTVGDEVSALLDSASVPAGTYAYQWYTVAGSSPAVPISGATADKYTVTAGDAGLVLQVKVTASKPGYNDASDTSDATSPVAKKNFTGTLVATIAGTPKVGVQLTANASGESPAGSYTYQWKADGTNISGATSSTFTPGAGQVGKAITVTVTATKAGYNDASDTSDPTAAVVKGDFTTNPTVTISGTPKVGVQLTANASGESPTKDSYTYVWKADAVAISGATSSTFTPGAAQETKQITVTVTAIKAGYNDASGTSGATAAVAKGDFTSQPTVLISGTPKVGVQLTASASGESPTKDSYTYVWKADNVAIAGETGSTFTPTAAEQGKAITVTVTATKAGYNDSNAVTSTASAPVAPAAPSTFTGTQTLTLSTTTPKVGDVVTVTPSGLTPAPTYSYDWYRIDTLGVRRVIPGAIGASYTVPYADLTKKLQVEVTATKDGYVTMSTFSAQTDRINYIALSKTSVTRGQTIGVNAKRLRAGQAYKIFVEGKSVYSGTATSDGSAIRTVTVPTSTPVGTGKRIWVSGYNKSGVRDFQVIGTVTVK